MKTFFKLITILFIFSFSTLPATAHVDDQQGNTEKISNDEDTHQEVTKIPLPNPHAYKPAEEIKITPKPLMG